MVFEAIAKFFADPKRYFYKVAAVFCKVVAFSVTKEYNGTNIEAYLDSVDRQTKWRERARNFTQKAEK